MGLGFTESKPIMDMDRIAQIESSGNPNAFNERSGCIGLFQINPKTALLDYNNYEGMNYTAQDLYNPQVNYLIANWYLNHRIPKMLRHYRKPDTVENRLIGFNCGITCVVDNRMPNETKDYIRKYYAR